MGARLTKLYAATSNIEEPSVTTSTFRFADVHVLWLLIPLIAYFVFTVAKRARKPNLYPKLTYSSLALLKQANLQAPKWKIYLAPTLRLVALALMILALARPQYGRITRERKASGVDILLALDVSGSMQGLDFEVGGKQVDRLTMLKTVAAEFVQKRPNDRMGILVFGSEVFTQCPLTLDHEVLQSYLAELQIGMAGDGTSIGDAIGLAVKRMDAVKSKSKIVVLLTDGENTSGVISPKTATQIAKEKQIKIYTVGIGADGDVPVAVQGFFGQTTTVNQRFPVDMELLKHVAEESGARSFRAHNTEELRQIYGTIDALEKSEFAYNENANFEEQMATFAIPALLFLLLEVLFGRLKYTRRLE